MVSGISRYAAYSDGDIENLMNNEDINNTCNTKMLPREAGLGVGSHRKV